jgi:hypothetical protein
MNCDVVKFHTLCWGRSANVITRPVRQNPRYATDHLIDSPERETTSNSSQPPSLHIIPTYVLNNLSSNTQYPLPVDTFPYVCTEHGRAHYNKHPSHVTCFIVFIRGTLFWDQEVDKERVQIRGGVLGVKVKKLSHGIWRGRIVRGIFKAVPVPHHNGWRRSPDVEQATSWVSTNGQRGPRKSPPQTGYHHNSSHPRW